MSTTSHPITSGRINVPVAKVDYLGAYQLVATPVAGPRRPRRDRRRHPHLVNGVR